MTNAQTCSALFPEKISKLEAIKVMVQSELNSVSIYVSQELLRHVSQQCCCTAAILR